MSRCFLRFWFVVILCGAPPFIHAEISPRLYAVELSAQVAVSPARVELVWPADANATGYTIDRKLLTAISWTRIASLAGTATSYADAAVAPGILYEYQVIKAAPYRTSGVGYIAAGIQLPAIENRGKLILLVDSTHAAALTNELRRLESDLVGDGWMVIRRDVARSATPPEVKAIVKSIYDADPASVRSLFIFGHVAVPYSGDIYPDMHPDHKGAWPTDAYYADLDGTWTDNTVNTTSAEKAWNRNTIGDGKFDQNNIPSTTELEVGRVDLYNMTCFANKTPSRSELDLLRQYLNKDHNYRHATFKLQRRGLVSDNFGETGGEAFAATGWRNFAPFFGAARNIQVGYGAYFNTLASQDYLFSYATGGGGWYTCNGVGSSDDFALNDTRSVFSFVFGSYFGDWDNESSFLRAPLGSTTYTLVSAWAGRPHWFMHPMAMGETIGHSARLTQNNRVGGTYRPNHFAGGAHVSLMGDPTLRLHTVATPRNVTLTSSVGNNLAWDPSADTNLAGYYLYRANSANGPFSRISGTSPLTTTLFNDATGTASHTYMVRAVKLESEASGTYYNLSQGVFAGANATPPPTPPQVAPAAPSHLTATTPTATNSVLIWRDNSTNETSFTVFRREPGQATFSQRATLAAGSTNFTDGITAGALYAYKVRASNAAGDSAFSAEAAVQSAPTPPPTTTLPAAPSFLVAAALTPTSSSLTWSDLSTNETGFQIFRRAPGESFTHRGSVGAGVTTFQDSIAAGVTFTYKVRAQNAVGTSAFSGEASIHSSGNIPNQPVAAAATFVGRDTNTLGTWKGVYGAQGYHVSGNAWKYPSAATVGISGHTADVWSWQTTDPSGLQRVNDATRLAYRWQSASSFELLTAFSDDQVRRISLYFVDWDGANRVQKIEALDADTSVVLASEVISDFADGLYLRWDIKGRVKLRITPIGGSAVLSAFFFDAPGPNPSPAAINVAEFIGFDTTTSGTWKGAYGRDGHLVVGDSFSLPADTTIAPRSQQQWIWAWSTQDARCPQRGTLNDRIAPCWYSGTSFEVDLKIGSGTSRLVSLYLLDWDRAGRSQRIELIDASTGSVLHTSNVASFQNGVYAQYRVKGQVRIRLTRVNGPNAVLSGLFVDP